MTKILHQVWIQGEANLPEKFAQNRKEWKAALPGWETRLWDKESACAQWGDVADVFDECSHHAMRADLILARALRDIGGLTAGTDMRPVNPYGLRKWCETHKTMLVVDLSEPEVSNGLVWSAEPKHEFFACVCKHQLRDRRLLKDHNIPNVTGPGAWWTALRAHRWDVCMVSVRHAYTRHWRERGITNPKAWVNPGYAASWWNK